MTPTWFPWLLIGGILFLFLGWMVHQWKIRTHQVGVKPYRAIQSLQDFISGAILIACVGISLPDLFPSWSDMEAWLPSTSSVMSTHGLDEEEILQVGPPRLLRGRGA